MENKNFELDSFSESLKYNYIWLIFVQILFIVFILTLGFEKIYEIKWELLLVYILMNLMILLKAYREKFIIGFENNEIILLIPAGKDSMRIKTPSENIDFFSLSHNKLKIKVKKQLSLFPLFKKTYRFNIPQRFESEIKRMLSERNIPENKTK